MKQLLLFQALCIVLLIESCRKGGIYIPRPTEIDHALIDNETEERIKSLEYSFSVACSSAEISVLQLEKAAESKRIELETDRKPIDGK